MLLVPRQLVWSMGVRREPAEAQPWQSLFARMAAAVAGAGLQLRAIPTINTDPYGYGMQDAPAVADFGAHA